MIAAGDVIGPLTVGPLAHGGHWVARWDGRVVFVRHALEGEIVTVRVRETARRFARGDVVEVLTPSPHRVPPPCAAAGACGGCDFQHVAVTHQRELKWQVVSEQARRLAGLDVAGAVEAVGPDAAGWRTRVRYVSDGHAWGLRRHRSHTVEPLPPSGCLLATAPLRRPPLPPGPAGAEVLGVESLDQVWWGGAGDDTVVRQRAAGRTHRVRADGFWQVHPAAADTLVAAVLAALDPRPGETALDLYCGVGVFAGALGDAGVRVIGVEGNADAVALARANVPEAHFVAGSVDHVWRRLPRSVDLVVLDPPRRGAGRAVMEQVAARRPRAVAYVACDPAALARDLATAAELGYRTVGVRAFDLFGHTHHVETVAVLSPIAGHRPRNPRSRTHSH